MKMWFSHVALFALIALSLGTSCQRSGGKKADSLIVWHWMTDREEALLELAKQYKEQTGMDVQFQLYAPSDTYTQKVRIGAQTESLPDIYGILAEARDLASFIKAGHVANLTASLGEGKDSWKSRFYTEALNTSYFEKGNRYEVSPGYYGIPIDVTTIPMILNRPLFRKAGLNPDKPPKTWDEFIAIGKKLQAAGVTGFVSGWGETWLIFSLATDLAHNLMGAPKVMDTFRGTVPYTDPDWVKLLEAFEKIEKSGIADQSLVTLDNKNSEKKFASERAAMTLNGSWCVNVYAGMNPNLDYAPFPPPALNPKNSRPVWGGAGSVFHVNDKSPHKENAIQFLKWLTDTPQASFLVKKTLNLPSVKNLGKDISPQLNAFSELMENSIHPNRFSFSEDPRVIETLTKGIQSILIGEKTPQQVAKDTAETKEKVLQNKL